MNYKKLIACDPLDAKLEFQIKKSPSIRPNYSMTDRAIQRAFSYLFEKCSKLGDQEDITVIFLKALDFFEDKNKGSISTFKFRQIILEKTNLPSWKIFTKRSYLIDSRFKMWAALDAGESILEMQAILNKSSMLMELNQWHTWKRNEQDLSKGFSKLSPNKVIFSGGVYGSGKSYILNQEGYVQGNAVSADTAKQMFPRNLGTEFDINATDHHIHVHSSQAALLAKNALDTNKSSSYIFDSSLRYLNDLESSLKVGKVCNVKYIIVPFEVSALRVLKRPVEGKDPLIPFEHVKNVYEGMFSIINGLSALKEKYRKKLKLEFYIPSHGLSYNTLSYELNSKSLEEITPYLKTIREDFDKIKLGKILVKQLINSVKISDEERAALSKNPMVRFYLSRSIEDALNEKANLW